GASFFVSYPIHLRNNAGTLYLRSFIELLKFIGFQGVRTKHLYILLILAQGMSAKIKSNEFTFLVKPLYIRPPVNSLKQRFVNSRCTAAAVTKKIGLI